MSATKMYVEGGKLENLFIIILSSLDISVENIPFLFSIYALNRKLLSVDFKVY